MQKADQIQPLSLLGSEEDCLKWSGTVSCEVYGSHVWQGKLYIIECSALWKDREEEYPRKKLPPTEDAFHLHLLWCAYQLLLWRQAIVPMPTVLDATRYGYERCTDGTGFLQLQMMSQSPAAPELLNDLVCDCHPDACAVGCSWLANGQPCTAVCVCESLVDGEEGLLCANP
jgi:hypothetical protein